MQIENKEGLASSRERQDVLDFFEAGIKSVLPIELIQSAIKYDKRMNSVTVVKRIYHLVTGRIFVIGGGKASGLMAEVVEDVIGADNIKAGTVNTVKGKYRTKKIRIREAGHPLPDKRGVRGVEEMLDLKADYKINERDLVICLLSGGGSALMPYPAGNIKLREMRTTSELLIKSGAPINEINIVRKHISRIKGGMLAQYFQPATVASIIISDVASNDLGSIASGPTTIDPSTYRDAYYVLEKYGLLTKVPNSVKEHIQRGFDGKELETPKILGNCDNFIVGKNDIALETMAMEARQRGYKPLILTKNLIGDPAQAARALFDDVRMGKYDNYDLLILGGETTPKVTTRHGKGGRNQHFVAAALLAFSDYEGDWLVSSVSSDGSDYMPEVAGALADKSTIRRIINREINIIKYLDHFDTYGLFKKTGSEHIITETTGTNVGDLMIIVKK